MTNEIEVQDKNQLALFTLLTREQEIEKANLIKKYREITDRLFTVVETKKAFLLKNGFEEGIHFVVDAVKSKRVDKANLSKWNEEKFIVEFEVDELEGNIYLLFNLYNPYDNKIYLQKSTLTLENDKINCHSLQNYSSRMIKPKTMLEKIVEANAIAERKFNNANKAKSVLDYTVEKYTKLFPKATVTKDRGYTTSYDRKNTTEFDLVNINFENGSFLSLRLGFEIDKEYIYKKIDVVANKQTILEVLNTFDLQNM